MISHPWTCGQVATPAEVKAECERRRIANETEAQEAEATTRYGEANAYRDFRLQSVIYYDELEVSNADNANAKILKVQEYSAEEHGYLLMKRADVAPDRIFSQLKNLLNA